MNYQSRLTITNQDKVEYLVRHTVNILDSQGYTIKWRHRALIKETIQSLLYSGNINGGFVIACKEVLRKKGLLYKTW